MAQSVFVAIDIGAESGRVLAGCLNDGTFTLDELHRFSNGPVKIGAHIHWDVLRLWAEIKNGLTIALQKYKNAVVSVGVDTWGVDFGLLDKNDELIGNPYHYRDTRTEGMLEEAFHSISRQDIYRKTGIQFIRINTLYQLLSMSRQQSQVLESAKSFLMMPDLFHFWLCGEKANEFTNATTTQFYNPLENQWATGMLEQMQIPSRILQPVMSAGTVFGELRPEIAAEIGANHMVKIVAPATHDTGSAVAAVPLTDENAAYISSGTWSLVGLELKKPIITDKSLEFNFTNEGGVGGTFRFLRNVMGLWLVNSCRQVWERAGKKLTHSETVEAAAAASSFKSLIDPDAERFLAPDDMPSEIKAFCRETGQPEPASEGEFIRCCLESLALKYRWVIERLEELAERTVSVIHIVGGGSQNGLLNQLTADVTGKMVIAGPVETTATGNALVQAVGLGYLGSHGELRDVVGRSFQLRRFEPRNTPQCESVYDRFAGWL